MFAEERRAAILAELTAEGRVQVANLAQRLEVSEVTIRQDLAALEEKGLLRRTHGGAIPVETGFELPFARTAGANAEEKSRIAAAAAAMVREGETIFLDVGTTTTAMARALLTHRRLTVVTSALNIAALLEEAAGITVILTGGTLRATQHSLVNPMGTEIISRVRADRAFIGASGVEAGAGVTNANFPEAEIKRAMMAAARQKVLLADGSKVGRIAAAVVGPLSSFDLLITSRDAPEKDLEALRAAGMEVRVV